MIFNDYSFTLNGSNDGTTWTQLDSQILTGTDTYILNPLTIGVGRKYTYYRILYSTTLEPNCQIFQLYGY